MAAPRKSNQILISKMGDLPVGYRARLRELTIGPVAWGLWSLTHHDGSTWTALALEDGEITGWAALTYEWDGQPVIGAYVSEEHRGRGVATLVITSLLHSLMGAGVISRGDTVAASTWRWPRYHDVLEACGLACEPWE
jgi:GNAT superfamily N-acetyltransferase